MTSRLPDGEPKEIQVEGAIAAGLRRFSRGFADLRTVPGWPSTATVFVLTGGQVLGAVSALFVVADAGLVLS
ncbi:hypothetical protein ACFWBQ_38175, partial [Streptomyces sp. NPDC060035]